jgi:hypothetical protein
MLLVLFLKNGLLQQALGQFPLAGGLHSVMHMTTKPRDEPLDWRERAREARIHADLISGADSKRAMLEIAAQYERIAERAQGRTDKRTPASPADRSNAGGRRRRRRFSFFFHDE